MSDIASASGVNALKIHIYKLGDSKQIALANIAITGEVKSATADGISRVVYRPETGKFYDLNGIENANPSKGIYIQNGKKIIIK